MIAHIADISTVRNMPIVTSLLPDCTSIQLVSSCLALERANDTRYPRYLSAANALASDNIVVTTIIPKAARSTK
jgi:hypothetical protein